MWSLYVGRPWGIDIRDVSISRPPRHLDKVRFKMWSPTPRPYESIPNDDIEALGWYDPVETYAEAAISLCVMMRELGQTV